MSILNYTTKVPVDQTLGEIQKMLRGAGAKSVMVEYDDAGEPESVAFRIDTAHGLIAFRLPARIAPVAKLLHNDPMARKDKQGRKKDQAPRVAWRIVKDWLEAQLAIVESEQAELPEVMLPFAQHANGKTLYQIAQDRGLPKLLESPNN